MVNYLLMKKANKTDGDPLTSLCGAHSLCLNRNNGKMWEGKGKGKGKGKSPCFKLVLQGCMLIIQNFTMWGERHSKTLYV